MPYLYLVFSVLGTATQTILTRFFQKSCRNTTGNSLYLGAVCGAVVGLLAFIVNGFNFHFSWPSFWLAVGYGVNGTFFNIFAILTMSKGDTATYTLFFMLGSMLLPSVFGMVFLNEPVTVLNVIGLLIMVAAVVLPFVLHKNKRVSKKFLFLCCIMFVLQGVFGIIIKWQQSLNSVVTASDFMVMFCALQCAFSLLTILFLSIKHRAKKAALKPPSEEGPAVDGAVPSDAAVDSPRDSAATTDGVQLNKKAVAVSVVLALSAYVATLFAILCAKVLPGAVQYPINTGGTIVLVGLASVFLFKEKLTVATVISYALVVLGVAFLVL